MAQLNRAAHTLNTLEEYALQKSLVHGFNPLSKLAVTVVYIVFVSSFGRYEIIQLLPMVFYPLILFALTPLDAWFFIKKTLAVLPLIVLVGIFNPFFDTAHVMVGHILIPQGWLTFLSVIIKGMLTVLSALLLIGTTGINGIAAALRKMRMPRIFVLQLVLTYRYISVLLQEISRVSTAYALRAPGRRGIQFQAWGSLAGGMMLRSFDRAQRVYDAMLLRGFDGDYRGFDTKFRFADTIFIFLCTLFFITVRYVNIPNWLGSLFTG